MPKNYDNCVVFAFQEYNQNTGVRQVWQGFDAHLSTKTAFCFDDEYVKSARNRNKNSQCVLKAAVKSSFGLRNLSFYTPKWRERRMLREVTMVQRIFLCLALFLILPLSQAFAEKPVLTIGVTNSPPLSLPDQSGMLDRMLKEAFSRIGVKVEFVTLPSERSLMEAERGSIDGDNNRVAGLQRRYPNLIQVPESNMTYEFMAFAVRPGITIKNWGDLDPLNVAYIIGWKILEDNVKAPSVTKVSTSAQLFSFLKAERADVVLFDRFGGNHHIKEFSINQAYAVEPPLAKREMYLYLNAKHAELVPALSKALRAMKADGSHARFFSSPN